jgi:hypothetical protein
MHTKMLLTLLILTVASAAFAAGTDRVVVSKQGAIVRRIPAQPAQSVPRTDTPDPSLVMIYNTLASKYPKSPYWGWTAASVNGPFDGLGDPELWTAMPFTPTANHTVTEVAVGVTLDSGTNGLVLSLNNDASGAPGTAVETWQLTNLPTALCCTVQVATDNAGIPVTAGTQYWIVLSTNSTEIDTSAGWNLSEIDQVDSATLAQYCSNDKGGYSCSEYGLQNDAWTTFPNVPGVAFAVLGSN